MALQFSKATKRLAKLRMSISGVAGSGKSYSALSIASNLGNKVAVLDTEHGSASKYADKFSFDVLELDSFHPQRYIEAIHAAEQAGYDVLVIDSLSHAWSGKDGALELVDRAAKKSGSQNKFMAWGDVTPLQNQLVDAIIAAKLHIIATMRSKTEYALQDYTDGNGRTKQKPVKLGLAPIQRDGMEYEFDILGEMDMQNTLTIVKSRASGLNGTEWEKPSKTLALAIAAWLNDAPAQPTPIVSTALHQSIAEREELAKQAAQEKRKGVEWEDFGEEDLSDAFKKLSETPFTKEESALPLIAGTVPLKVGGVATKKEPLRAEVRTSLWSGVIEKAIGAGYVSEDKSTPFRLLTVVYAAGIKEVTKENLNHVWFAISKYYEDKKQTEPQPA